MTQVFLNKREAEALEDAGLLSGEEVVVDDVLTRLLQGTRPAPFQRVSKHRAGRTRPLTKEERRKRDRELRIATQARKKLHMERQADLRAFLAATNHD